MSRLELWRMYDCLPEPAVRSGAQGQPRLSLYLTELSGILRWMNWLTVHMHVGESDGSIWLFLLDLPYTKYSFRQDNNQQTISCLFLDWRWMYLTEGSHFAAGNSVPNDQLRMYDLDLSMG